MSGRLTCCAVLIAGMALVPAQAQEKWEKTSIPFAGGTFTIAENEDLEKVLSFDGEELARDYVLYYDRTVELNGTDVALFDIGPGGNACGTATLIAWKPEGGTMQTAQAGDDCGSPPPAITGGSIYFVPYLLPGDSALVQVWDSTDGMRVAGELSFVPQLGTEWGHIDPAALGNMIEIFGNEDVYDAAKALLGDALTEVASGLIVSDGIHAPSPGVFYGSGCVPHACGAANAFMAVDADGRKLYFAQQDGEGAVRTWPADGWPADIEHAMTNTLMQQ